MDMTMKRINEELAALIGDVADEYDALPEEDRPEFVRKVREALD